MQAAWEQLLPTGLRLGTKCERFFRIPLLPMSETLLPSHEEGELRQKSPSLTSNNAALEDKNSDKTGPGFACPVLNPYSDFRMCQTVLNTSRQFRVEGFRTFSLPVESCNPH